MNEYKTFTLQYSNYKRGDFNFLSFHTLIYIYKREIIMKSQGGGACMIQRAGLHEAAPSRRCSEHYRASPEIIHF